VEAQDTDTIYEVPLLFEEAGLAELVVRRLGMPVREPELSEWRQIVTRIKRPTYAVDVAVVGKYIENGDAYISIAEALKHAGIANDARVNVHWVDSEELERNPPADLFGDVDAILVAPGFGGRGVEGKIVAANYARTARIPFLGVCYGMQMAVVEFARNVANLENAHTEEVAPDTPHPLIHILPDQRDILDKGATMRLGAYKCQLIAGSLAERLYGTSSVYERHRHRFELNNDYRETLAKLGMVCSGLSPDYRLVEIVEIPSHPYFIATQFHPEFRSRPNRAHPLFSGLIEAAVGRTHRLFDSEGAASEATKEAVATVAAPPARKKGPARSNGRGDLNSDAVEALEL
jgi:CTP synthase